MRSKNITSSHVAVADNRLHTHTSVQRAFRDLLDRMDPPLPTLLRTGDHVLVKPFLHYGDASPNSRMVSHPEVMRAVIAAVRDCGAIVTLGDVAPEKRRHAGGRVHEKWIHDIARSTDVKMVNFGEAGAKYVKSRLIYPRRYLISRAVLDVDKVVGCANFQPHAILLLSGAVKNMFNAVVGKCQQHLHNVLTTPDSIARVIVDVCAAVKPTVSFLDVTSVRHPSDAAQLHPVGLILAGTDPVALDAMATRAAGFPHQNAPTLRLGQQMGLGCSDTDAIRVTGLDWQQMPSAPLKALPPIESTPESLGARTSRFVNNVILRPTPQINPTGCSGCGECQPLCPVNAIERDHGGGFRINSRKCAHCHLCMDMCQTHSIGLQFGTLATSIRRLMKKPLTVS